jgi:hypothetical protein
VVVFCTVFMAVPLVDAVEAAAPDAAASVPELEPDTILLRVVAALIALNTMPMALSAGSIAASPIDRA